MTQFVSLISQTLIYSTLGHGGINLLNIMKSGQQLSAVTVNQSVWCFICHVCSIPNNLENLCDRFVITLLQNGEKWGDDTMVFGAKFFDRSHLLTNGINIQQGSNCFHRKPYHEESTRGHNYIWQGVSRLIISCSFLPPMDVFHLVHLAVSCTSILRTLLVGEMEQSSSNSRCRNNCGTNLVGLFITKKMMSHL